jgi:hypothetical protein
VTEARQRRANGLGIQQIAVIGSVSKSKNEQAGNRDFITKLIASGSPCEVS